MPMKSKSSNIDFPTYLHHQGCPQQEFLWTGTAASPDHQKSRWRLIGCLPHIASLHWCPSLWWPRFLDPLPPRGTDSLWLWNLEMIGNRFRNGHKHKKSELLVQRTRLGKIKIFGLLHKKHVDVSLNFRIQCLLPGGGGSQFTNLFYDSLWTSSNLRLRRNTHQWLIPWSSDLQRKFAHHFCLLCTSFFSISAFPHFVGI